MTDPTVKEAASLFRGKRLLLKEAAQRFSHLSRKTELFLSGGTETTSGVKIRSHGAIFDVTNKMWHLGTRAVSSQLA